MVDGVDDLACDDVGFDVEAVARGEAFEGGVLEGGGDEGDLEPWVVVWLVVSLG